jgi:hypothetical protein
MHMYKSGYGYRQDMDTDMDKDRDMNMDMDMDAIRDINTGTDKDMRFDLLDSASLIEANVGYPCSSSPPPPTSILVTLFPARCNW